VNSNPVVDAIKARRNVRGFRLDKPVSRELVKEVLDSAMWAPSHHLTEPWRFLVIAGDERKKLGEVMAIARESNSGGVPAPQERLDRERAKPLAASVIIAIVSCPKQGKDIVPQEEVIAAGAALQNMLLAAHSLGLGTKLVTGLHAYSGHVRQFLELKDSELLVCLVYLGYPDGETQLGKRSNLDDKVSWRGM
jgi:nitroreductase